jgi:DNA-binding protein H-NS
VRGEIHRISRAPTFYVDNKCLVVSANRHETAMRKLDLATMQFEELWQLYEELTKLLADKVVAEKRDLEDRLAKLNRVEIVREAGGDQPLSLSMMDRAPRRKYPEVLPKYRNPLVPSQTWSGRGRTPRWVVAALNTGRRLDDLKIEHLEQGVRKEASIRRGPRARHRGRS